MKENVVISCCGVVCSECASYPAECKGCPAIKGKVYWLEYTGGEVCEIYDCCMNQKQFAHCGKCSELPCGRYESSDPTKTEEENDEDHRKQMEQLQKLISADKNIN